MVVIGHTRGLGKLIHESFGGIGFSSAEIDLRYPERILEQNTFGNHTDLVYNSGLGYDDIVTNIHPDRLRDMINVNLMGAMLMTRQFIRHLLANERPGTITFISSVSSQIGFRGLSMYGATKAGLEAFARGVAVEWKPKGIRCNCVAPAFMETDMTAKLSPEKKQKIKRWTDPNDVVSAIGFILNTQITGETIRV